MAIGITSGGIPLTFLWGTFSPALLHYNITRRGRAGWKVSVWGSSVVRDRMGRSCSSIRSYSFEDESRTGFFVSRRGGFSHCLQFLVLSRRGLGGLLLFGQSSYVSSFWASNILSAWEQKQRRIQKTHTYKILLAGVKGTRRRSFFLIRWSRRNTMGHLGLMPHRNRWVHLPYKPQP